MLLEAVSEVEVVAVLEGEEVVVPGEEEEGDVVVVVVSEEEVDVAAEEEAGDKCLLSKVFYINFGNCYHF